MITKTFRDICDLVELVSMLKNARFEISMVNGFMSIEASAYTTDANGLIATSDPLRVDGCSTIPGYLETIDRACRIIEEKIKSGEWEKNDDCA